MSSNYEDRPRGGGYDSDDDDRRPMGGRGGGRRMHRRRVCRFCIDKVDLIDFKDVRLLLNYLPERGKILPRRISGNCATHQRMLAEAIKRARNIALLPLKYFYAKMWMTSAHAAKSFVCELVMLATTCCRAISLCRRQLVTSRELKRSELHC